MEMNIYNVYNFINAANISQRKGLLEAKKNLKNDTEQKIIN